MVVSIKNNMYWGPDENIHVHNPGTQMMNSEQVLTMFRWEASNGWAQQYSIGCMLSF